MPRNKTKHDFSPKVVEWLNSQKTDTRRIYSYSWQQFKDFIKITGDEVLADKQADKTHKWEKKILEFKQWLISTKGLSENTARAAAMTVCGFFAFHYQRLQFRRPQARRVGEGKRKTQDYKFSRNDLQKMNEDADLEESYVLLAGKSFGLRAGDFIQITVGDLKPYLDREPPISIGEFDTQKEAVVAYPFIDRDALPVIKRLISKLERTVNATSATRMVGFKRTVTLSRILRRLVANAGIDTGNKRVRFHCLRKYLADRLSSVMSESKWKQIVGKTISEGAYISAESLGADYAKACDATCFPRSVKDIKEFEIQKILQQSKKHLSPEQLQELEKQLRTKTLVQMADMDEILKIVEGIKGNGNNKCSNGNCQRIVSEEELSRYLGKGWHVVTALPSGKIVIDDSR